MKQSFTTQRTSHRAFQQYIFSIVEKLSVKKGAQTLSHAIWTYGVKVIDFRILKN